jgi:hypothetical protein
MVGMGSVPDARIEAEKATVRRTVNFIVEKSFSKISALL